MEHVEPELVPFLLANGQHKSQIYCNILENFT